LRQRGKYPVSALCAFFKLSRSAYYAWLRQGPLEALGDPRCSLVRQAWSASHRTYGYRRVQVAIQREHGQIINHKAVLRMMQGLGIRSVARKPNPYRVPSGSYFYADLLQRDFSAQRPNQKWCGDITYIRTRVGFVYLSVFKDLFDGFIVGHHVARHNSVELVLRTMREALSQQAGPKGLWVHTDQGHQYSSLAYRAFLEQHGLRASLSRRGNALDNAPAESFFSQLKQEWIQDQIYLSFEEARSTIQDYIHFYNYERIQLKTKLTPFELRRQFV